MIATQPKPVGFRYEKEVTYVGLFLTIVSTVLLIRLTLDQHKHLKNQMAEAQKKKGSSTED